jgi:hypothetical protein
MSDSKVVTGYNITVHPEGQLLMLEVEFDSYSDEPGESPFSSKKAVMQCWDNGNYKFMPGRRDLCSVRLFSLLIDDGVIEISGQPAKNYQQFQPALRNFLVYEGVRLSAMKHIRAVIEQITDPLTLLRAAKHLQTLLEPPLPPDQVIGGPRKTDGRPLTPLLDVTASQLAKGLDLLNGKPVTYRELFPV